MSRSVRKPTLLTLRKVSTRISISLPLILVSPPVDFLFQESLLYTSIPLRRNVSARISLRGLRWLIWVDTLRRVNNVFYFILCILAFLLTFRLFIELLHCCNMNILFDYANKPKSSVFQLPR